MKHNKYTVQDFWDDIDNLQYDNDNDNEMIVSYYRGKASGYRATTDMASKINDLAVLEDWLYSCRKNLLQEKDSLKYNDNSTEKDRCFIHGELDAINEARNLLRHTQVLNAI